MSDRILSRINEPYIAIIADLAEAAFVASRESIRKHNATKHRPAASPRRQTLRPGMETPMWNEMQKRLRFHTMNYGAKAVLARELGLPRQRIHQFLKEGSAMPDAERTLCLLAWLDSKEKSTS